MISKVNVIFPEDMKKLEEKAAEEVAKILIKKLHPEEVEQLIKLLQKDEIHIKL